MQFFRGKNKKDNNSSSNDINNSSGDIAATDQVDDNTTTDTTFSTKTDFRMQENDLLSELDELASSEPNADAGFSDDQEIAIGGGGGMRASAPDPADNIINLSGTPSAGAAAHGSGGMESLKMIDSDDGADMDIFDDDDEDYGGGGGIEELVEKSPISLFGTGVKKKVSPALRDEIKELLNTPLTIPTLVQPRGGRGAHKDREMDDLPTSDDEHDEEDDEDGEDKSSESGEDYTDDEDEGESGYKPGGYHPVNVGDVFNQG